MFSRKRLKNNIQNNSIQCLFPFAFPAFGEKSLVIHASSWPGIFICCTPFVENIMAVLETNRSERHQCSKLKIDFEFNCREGWIFEWYMNYFVRDISCLKFDCIRRQSKHVAMRALFYHRIYSILGSFSARYNNDIQLELILETYML